MGVTRPTYVEIDLAALKHNLLNVKQAVGKDCHVLAVVKADAYGHGVARVAPALAEAGADLFGVALVEEGVETRSLGVHLPILVLGGVFQGQEQDVIASNLTPVISDLDCAYRLNKVARTAGCVVNYHLKVDTGMGRLGFLIDQLDEVLPELLKLKSLKMEGLLSHLAVADEPERSLTEQQYASFADVVRKVEEVGFSPYYKHIANSAGIYSQELAGCNLVRPGISLYGGLTGGPYKESLQQQPVMRFVTQVARLKKLSAGKGISYGHRFITQRDSLVAAIPVGYADGYNRLLTNCGEVLIRGQRAPVAGTVCMDWVLVDVTDVPDVKLGDQVTLLGADGDDAITAEEWADKVNSITYEVFCGVSKRVPRVYLGT